MTKETKKLEAVPEGEMNLLAARAYKSLNGEDYSPDFIRSFIEIRGYTATEAEISDAQYEVITQGTPTIIEAAKVAAREVAVAEVRSDFAEGFELVKSPHAQDDWSRPLSPDEKADFIAELSCGIKENYLPSPDVAPKKRGSWADSDAVADRTGRVHSAD